MKRLTFALAFASTLTAAAIGRADEKPSEAPRWYGYQTLIIDASSVTLLTSGAFAIAREGDNRSAWSDTPIVLGLSGYFLGGPIVHWAHGHVLKGFLDLGLRVALPFAGYGLGNIRPNGEGYGILAGTLVGVGGAIVIDAAILGFEPPPPRPAEVGLPAPRVTSWSVSF